MGDVIETPGGSSAEPPGRPLRRLVLRLTLSGTVLILGLIAVEVGLRLVQQASWRQRMKEDQSLEKMARAAGQKRANLAAPHGPRHRNLARVEPKAADTYRILFLGDSFTYGTGVPDASKVFVSLLEKRLNAELPHPHIRRYQLFNGGVSGSLTRGWVRVFDLVADRFAPDLVVAVFFLWDGVGTDHRRFLIDLAEQGNPFDANRSALYRYSHIYRRFRERIERQWLQDKFLGTMRKAYLGGPPDTKEWRRAQANLLYLREQTVKRGARFAVVIFPLLLHLNEHYPMGDVCDTIDTFCREQDLAVFSLLPTYMHRNGPSLWVTPFDFHPNAEGHALAADGIYEFIEPLIVGGRSAAPR